MRLNHYTLFAGALTLLATSSALTAGAQCNGPLATLTLAPNVGQNIDVNADGTDDFEFILNRTAIPYNASGSTICDPSGTYFTYSFQLVINALAGATIEGSHFTNTNVSRAATNGTQEVLFTGSYNDCTTSGGGGGTPASFPFMSYRIGSAATGDFGWFRFTRQSVDYTGAVVSIDDYTFADVSTAVTGQCLGAPLPVALSYFNASRAAGSAQLEWSSATELNVSHYEVQRSFDAADFTTVESLNAAGDSEIEQTYSFIDERLGSRAAYYRLRVVDFDGLVTYSSMQYVASFGVRGERIVGANVVKTGSSITVTTDDPIRILNTAGVLISQVPASQSGSEVQLGNLVPGVYFLATLSGQSQRLIVR